MESIIFQQIRDAVDEEYIAAYLDDTTGNFTCQIPDLLTYLINTYAYISEEELEMKRAEVAATEYEAGQPMDTVLHFANLADLAHTTISEAQKIAMAKDIIVKIRAYADYITEWNIKLAQQKTWTNFMTFFRQAHKELKQSRPTPKDIASTNSKHTFVLDALPAGTLISLGQLCDDGCIATFTKYDVQIKKEGQVLIQGKRNKTSRLWQINNQQQPEANNYKEQPETNNYKEHEAYGIINSRTTKQTFAKYRHACALSPVISTWTKAIKKGHFATWSGLIEELVQKYYNPNDEISMGHMKAKKWSSKRAPQRTVSDPDPFLPDLEPPQEANNQPTHNLFTTIWETSERTYSDQTGAFPIQSSRGNKYIFIMYAYDANAIMVEPIKSRQAKTITEASIKCYKTTQ